MKAVIDALNAKCKVYHLNGASEAVIKDAEQKLGLSFPPEYRTYLATYGVLSFASHEFTGLGTDGYLNVVTATEKERSLGGQFPKDCILLENNGIDGLLTIQDSKGCVYSFKNGTKKKIASSFSEYIKMCLE